MKALMEKLKQLDLQTNEFFNRYVKAGCKFQDKSAFHHSDSSNVIAFFLTRHQVERYCLRPWTKVSSIQLLGIKIFEVDKSQFYWHFVANCTIELQMEGAEA